MRTRKQHDTRQPPRNIDAEKQVIGAIMLLKHFPNSLALRRDQFYDDVNRIVYGHLDDMAGEGLPVDVTVLQQRLIEAGQYDRIGRGTYISELSLKVPTATNIVYYANIVRELARKREQIEIGIELSESGYNGVVSEQAIARALSRLVAIQAEDNEPEERATLVVCRMSDVQPKPIEWMWPGRIAIGKLTIVSGDPGLGKSILLLDLVARVSRGTKWPDCDSYAPLGSAIIMSAEDDIDDTIRPRLDAASADVSKIIAIRSVQSTDDAGDYERTVDLQRDLPKIEKQIDANPDTKLILIDPISCFMGDADSHNNAETRAVLAPLVEMAARRRVAVVCLSHLKKAEAAAIYKTMGSLAFTAAARAVFAVAVDKDDPTGNRKLFLPVKANLSGGKKGLSFELSMRHGSGDHPCIVWGAVPVETTADDALAPKAKRRGPEPEEREDAEQFLLDALANGPRPVKEIDEEAHEGHGITKRTLERARRSVGVVPFRESPKGAWMIRLPRPPTRA